MEILTDYETRTTVTLRELLPAWWGTERYGSKFYKKGTSALTNVKKRGIIATLRIWRGVRAVYGAGLENR